MRRLGLVVTGLYLATPVAALAGPNKSQTELCHGAGIKVEDCNSAAQTASFGASIAGVANTLIYIAGAAAVIALIGGGLLYVTSTGDSARIKQAKETIMFAVIGIVVTLLAYAIVNFVIARI